MKITVSYFKTEILTTLSCTLIMFIFTINLNYISALLWLGSYLCLPLIGGFVSFQKNKSVLYSSMVISSGMSIFTTYFVIYNTANTHIHGLPGYEYRYPEYWAVIIIATVIGFSVLALIAAIGEYIRKKVRFKFKF